MASYDCWPNSYVGSFGTAAWNDHDYTKINTQDNSQYTYASQPNRGAIYGLDQPAGAGSVSAGTLYYRGRWAVGSNNVTAYLTDGSTTLTTYAITLTSSNTTYTQSYACPASAVGSLDLRHLSASGNPAEVRCYWSRYSLDSYTPPAGEFAIVWSLPLIGILSLSAMGGFMKEAQPRATYERHEIEQQYKAYQNSQRGYVFMNGVWRQNA